MDSVFIGLLLGSFSMPVSVVHSVWATDPYNRKTGKTLRGILARIVESALLNLTRIHGQKRFACGYGQFQAKRGNCPTWLNSVSARERRVPRTGARARGGEWNQNRS